ncbi:MAG: hypothetical protein ACRCTR_09565 [Actinomycetota bacterium]
MENNDPLQGNSDGPGWAIRARWPELFEPLTREQCALIDNAMAYSFQIGMVPDRDTVSDLIDVTRGLIDEAEYHRRTAVMLAKRHRAGSIAHLSEPENEPD